MGIMRISLLLPSALAALFPLVAVLPVSAQDPAPAAKAAADGFTPLFDGKTFAGWEGETTKVWRIVDGVIAVIDDPAALARAPGYAGPSSATAARSARFSLGSTRPIAAIAATRKTCHSRIHPRRRPRNGSV